MEPIRVVLVDDHQLVREALIKYLGQQRDVEVVGEGGTADDALELVTTQNPDVLVLDLRLPGDGHTALKKIAATSPSTRVLIVTGLESDGHAIRALRSGAAGYLRKGASMDEFVSALRTIHAGKRYVPEDIAERLLDGVLDGDIDAVASLTDRERQVMMRLAAGATNREIAKALGISVRTVDSHRGNILRKLSLRNNVELTRFAIDHGYLEA